MRRSMALSEAPETSGSRKKMRFTMPLPHPSSEEEESKHDQEPSQCDGDDKDGQDEEADQVEEQGQRNRDLLESDNDDVEGLDEEDEQVEEERQSDQALSEYDCVDKEGQDEDDEQVEQERQSDHEDPEFDDDEKEMQGVEEEQEQEEIQNDQQPLESAGDDEEGHGEEGEQGEDVSEGDDFPKGSSKLASARSPKRTVMANLTLDEDMLDCGVCFLPLKPPIFQCEVGHVLCSSCRDKLAAAGRCHVCCAFGYRRCHAMEQLLESIRVSCPNAAYGCAVRMAYYDQDTHLRECRHAPCHCPAEACGFVGSTAALLDHFTGTHKWACTTDTTVGESVVMDLHDGFNVVAAVRGTIQYLFLLNVARKPFGRAVSALCIHPQPAVDEWSLSSPSPSKNPECELHLKYSCYRNKSGNLCCYHFQESTFKVACTDLSNGLPNPDQDCFQFVVHNSVLPDSESSLNVRACITIK